MKDIVEKKEKSPCCNAEIYEEHVEVTDGSTCVLRACKKCKQVFKVVLVPKEEK